MKLGKVWSRNRNSVCGNIRKGWKNPKWRSNRKRKIERPSGIYNTKIVLNRYHINTETAFVDETIRGKSKV